MTTTFEKFVVTMAQEHAQHLISLVPDYMAAAARNDEAEVLYLIGNILSESNDLKCIEGMAHVADSGLAPDSCAAILAAAESVIQMMKQFHQKHDKHRESRLPNPESELLPNAVIGGAGLGLPRKLSAPPGKAAVLLYVPAELVIGRAIPEIQSDLGLPWHVDGGEPIWLNK